MTTQSSSPRKSFASLLGSIRRSAASDGADASVESRAEGRDGSSSWMTRIISANAALCSRLASIGRSPVSSSYRITPSE